MKRWTFRIVLMLILGTVMTVGVAWGLAVSRTWNWAGDYYIRSDEAHIATFILPHATMADRTRAVYCAWGRGWSTANIVAELFSVEEMSFFYPEALDSDGALSKPPSEYDVSDSGRDYSIYAFGWPRRCVRGIIRGPQWNGVTPPSGFEDAYIVVLSTEAMPFEGSRYPRPTRFVPYYPIFPGFLINTLFYAVIWFALIFGWRAHMRMIRRWQGHCPMCSYDLRGDLDTPVVQNADGGGRRRHVTHDAAAEGLHGR